MALICVRLRPRAAEELISILLRNKREVNVLAIVLVHIDWLVVWRWCQRNGVDGDTLRRLGSRVLRVIRSHLRSGSLLLSRGLRSRVLGVLRSRLRSGFLGSWFLSNRGLRSGSLLLSRGLRSRVLGVLEVLRVLRVLRSHLRSGFLGSWLLSSFGRRLMVRRRACMSGNVGWRLRRGCLGMLRCRRHR
jgi:hypothetical protein